MSLGTLILILSTVLYLAAGIAFWFEEQHGLSVAYIAYAVANIGLMMVALKGTA